MNIESNSKVSNSFRQGYLDDLRNLRNATVTLKDDFYSATVFDKETCKAVGDCCRNAENQFIHALQVIGER